MLVLVLYIVLHCLALGLRPKPPTQTAVQAAVVANKSIIAKNASLNAIPSLLAHLDSSLSRSALAHDCPALANASAAEILRRLVAEIEVAELVQSLGGGQYQTMPQLFETTFLYNIWEAQFNFTRPECADFEDWNERHLFGLPVSCIARALAY